MNLLLMRRTPLARLLMAGLLLAAASSHAEERALPAPNYDLAARWMPSKIGKLVFDTSVAPHWAEASDRFFYAFETAQGRKFHLVDPLKRGKVKFEYTIDRNAKYLLGRSSESVDLLELSRETPQGVKKRPGAGGGPEEIR